MDAGAARREAITAAEAVTEEDEAGTEGIEEGGVGEEGAEDENSAGL